MEVQADRLPLDEQPEALTIAALYRQVHAAVAAAFPKGRATWVRGEIQSISDRTGHCYMDLVDPDVVGGRDTPVLKVNCWGRTWGPLKASLAKQGVFLEPGTVVTLRGRVEFYAPRAQVNFIASGVDVSALLGSLAARRAALLATLEAEGLLERNRSLGLSPVPLRVALVASTRSEGYNDFVGQLRGSGLAFSVALYRAGVQGPGAPASVARALHAAAASACDLIVLVRGGGSRGDLVAFDHELVARAVASSPLPVWTGIGHTGDRSVADVVAHRAFVTPTECGQEVVARVRQWWEATGATATRIARAGATAVEAAAARDATARLHLGHAGRTQLQRHAARLQRSSAGVAFKARAQLDAAGTALDRCATRLGVCARTSLARQDDRVATWRRLLAAYDVARQLERGYSITSHPDGAVVRSAADLEPGARIVTRFADGGVTSTVEGTDARDREAAAP